MKWRLLSAVWYRVSLPTILVSGLVVGAEFNRAAAAAVPAPAPEPDGRIALERLLSQEARRLDSRFLVGITNRLQWEIFRRELYTEYLEALGLLPMPVRTPLQAQVTGVLQRKEGFRVEKVHFQSRPHLYVTGNLYLPREAAPGAKLPAVLYVCGHSGKGRDGNKTAFQQHGMWFATHGYVCLIIDTLQLGEIAAIHHGTYRYDRWWWQARGYTPAAVECWNGVRALDYLQTRPEVDRDRLAVTGISGGGAATFWITAADERVKVAVPVSGMSDLEDYVGQKVVNGHCDCMFLINTFQLPWTDIAALVAPRPLLFLNSGHDTIFPMPGNERIRARLEQLYGFYTNRTDRLFDIGVTPGGHDDKLELRLMAYRWINRHLKGDDAPVTEPVLPPFPGEELRVFPADLPADELNTRIDEFFVAQATNAPPRTLAEWKAWRNARLGELHRIVFPGLPTQFPAEPNSKLETSRAQVGTWPSEGGLSVPWRFVPAHKPGKGAGHWLIVLNEDEAIDPPPPWVEKALGNVDLLLVAPQGGGPMRWQDPAPYYIRRSLPLLGRTIDSCRLIDTLAAAAGVLRNSSARHPWKIAGYGAAGVLAAYAAVFEPRLSEVLMVDPPTSHRERPIFLNVLRVADLPEMLGLLAPRPLTIYTARADDFAVTAEIYHLTGRELARPAWP